MALMPTALSFALPQGAYRIRLADLLVGAAAIGRYLRDAGLPITDLDVYYIHKSQKLPIGKWGKFLIASKKRLSIKLRALVPPT
jgi:hypothetical protein